MKWIIALLLLCGCSKSIVIDMPMTRGADTTEVYTPRERKDSVEISGIPIGFEVSVEDWADAESCLTLNVY